MVPLLYNVYLTNRYFPQVFDSFTSTFRAIISLMNSVEDSDKPPPLRNRDGANNFHTNMANDQSNLDMESLARDIFLKFLRETPIQILKGLCELIDPHVAISKFIRDITGQVFNQMAGTMTPVIQAEPTGMMEAAGTTGADVLNLAFCGYNLGNAFASGAAAGLSLEDQSEGASGDIDPNAPMFGPKITMKGVDFTGSLAGLFMAPPLPFGIIYLLLRFLLEQAEDALGGESEITATIDVGAGDSGACDDDATGGPGGPGTGPGGPGSGPPPGSY